MEIVVAWKWAFAKKIEGNAVFSKKRTRHDAKTDQNLQQNFE